MATFKAVIIMALWTALAGYGLVQLGVGEHFRDPLWAIGTGFALIAIWMVNFAIFFKVSKDEPWAWFRS